ncbi:hypothetical protein [Mycolicibacterium llatzerense]|uniref:hypothetical protein n=1 Tax=Mycolicibacterium llatzerense TaxID=280871 RepID=UPI0021B646E8|nr:hypothetical protein [Mycolicibacterium llatzerense]
MAEQTQRGQRAAVIPSGPRWFTKPPKHTIFQRESAPYYDGAQRSTTEASPISQYISRHDSPNVTLSPEEHSWVEFALRWADFTTGDEFIMQEFGMQPNVFYCRLLDLLKSRPSSTLTESQRKRLIDLCFRRSQAGIPPSLPAIHVPAPRPRRVR